VTSRSLPQQIAQIFSPFAGQNLSRRRFWQIGHGSVDATNELLAHLGAIGARNAGRARAARSRRTCDRKAPAKIEARALYLARASAQIASRFGQ